MGFNKDMDLGEIIKSIKIDKFILIFSLILVFVLGISFYFNSQIVYDNLVKKKEIKTLKEKSEIFKTLEQSLMEERIKVNGILEKKKNFANIFYTKNEKDKFIEEFNSLIEEYNLLTLNIVKSKEEKIEFVNPDDAEEKIELFEKTNIEMLIYGAFDDFMFFNNELAKTNKIITIHNVGIASKDEDGKVNVKIDLTIYKLIDGDDNNTKEIL